jgi:hypothetical protein
VYPLEALWDINDNAKKLENYTLNKDDLVYAAMIRQPNFLTKEKANEFKSMVFKKTKNPLIEAVEFIQVEEGPCVQMMHLGSYANEAESFKQMENFATTHNYKRRDKTHREIYLNDPRKTEETKLQTVLRFAIA